MTTVVNSAVVQKLLDQASGKHESSGQPRIKTITRDLLEALMTIIEKHSVSESEFWGAIDFLQKGAAEYGLIVPGVGIEHFLDLLADEQDKQAGRSGGTPRTIEGPLYVEGAPLVTGEANLTQDPDDSEVLKVSGKVKGPQGEAVKNAVLHVWHANSKGFYSHFDPTGAQSPFNNRRRITLGPDGHFAFQSKMPRGYSVPPNGATDRLMAALGRSGDRPAHVHFFIEAPGYRTLTTQINFGDDPNAHKDFAFGTREGLLPIPVRRDGVAHVQFDFQLQKAGDKSDQRFSSRPRLRG